MILRPYQEIAVDDASTALDKHKNTIVVAPLCRQNYYVVCVGSKRYKVGNKVLIATQR